MAEEEHGHSWIDRSWQVDVVMDRVRLDRVWELGVVLAEIEVERDGAVSNLGRGGHSERRGVYHSG